eukprot:4388259-Amphidinium_carterae.1
MSKTVYTNEFSSLLQQRTSVALTTVVTDNDLMSDSSKAALSKDKPSSASRTYKRIDTNPLQNLKYYKSDSNPAISREEEKHGN